MENPIYGKANGKIYENHGKSMEIMGNSMKFQSRNRFVGGFLQNFPRANIEKDVENPCGNRSHNRSTLMVGFTSNSCGCLIIIHNSKRIIWRFRTNKNCVFTMAIAELSMKSSANGYQQ